MPNNLRKSLHGYMKKIKKETGKLHFSSSKRWVIESCKHPNTISSLKLRPRTSKTRSNDDHHDPGHAAPLSNIDRFFEESYKSLGISDGDEKDDSDAKKKQKMESSDEYSDEDEYRHRFERTWGLAVDDSPKLPDALQRRTERLPPPPGSSEGRQTMNTTSTTSEEGQSNSSTVVLPENCIVVLRHTADAQEDFKRSMLEMMESKFGGVQESEVDWDLMEEILFCYLNLNGKNSHKFILSAFVDLIVSLRDK